MQRLPWFVWLLVAMAGCGDDEPPHAMVKLEVRIDGKSDSVSGSRVVLREVTRTATGLLATLVIDDGWEVYAREGAAVTIGGWEYECVRIVNRREDDKHGVGYVVLRRWQSRDGAWQSAVAIDKRIRDRYDGLGECMSDLWIEDAPYVRENGTFAYGPTAELELSDCEDHGTIRLHVGSRVTVGGLEYECVEIDRTSFHVVMRRWQPAD